MDNAFVAADDFLLCNARLLERRLFATHFLGQPAAKVVDALRGYQNDDGGFGHALEPDTRCPASLPIYVETAFQAMAIAGITDDDMVGRACDYLARLATSAGTGGAVAPASPVIEQFPRAAHWSEWTYEPGLNPTAGLAGLLHQLGCDHPWRALATRYCWERLKTGTGLDEPHVISEVLVFLEHVPDRERAQLHAEALAARFPDVPGVHLDPASAGYGLSPLHFAPTISSRWRSLFTEGQVNGHLDKLKADQQPDGGWPVTWEPPSEAARLEWRGIITLQALQTLVSYGRVMRT